MGIDALRTTANDLSPEGNEDIADLLREMITVEEEFEKKWKEYL